MASKTATFVKMPQEQKIEIINALGTIPKDSDVIELWYDKNNVLEAFVLYRDEAFVTKVSRGSVNLNLFEICMVVLGLIALASIFIWEL